MNTLTTPADHTPTPWMVHPIHGYICQDPPFYGPINLEDRANAELIVRAVNSATQHTENQRLKEELAELTAWKKEQMAVFGLLDIQGIAKALNLPLGSLITPHVLPAIRRLQAVNEALVGALETAEVALSCLRASYECSGDVYDGYASRALPVVRAAITNAGSSTAAGEGKTS